MRIAELVLERYGAFETKRLDLDRSPFTIVYGPNEAGKSTCLAAISDFFFKMKERSPRLSRFGSDAARIHATIVAADGRRLTLQRRHGRVRTLIGADGSACDDAVLSALLGSTDRDRFENLFAIDHAVLRSGGDALLDPEGDIGRLIVEAGGGLRSLVARLAAVDAEIDNLFAPTKKASRLFYQSASAFDEAQKSVKAALLTHDTWDRDRKANAAAREHLEAVRRAKAELVQEVSRLKRIERTIPHLRAMEAAERSLADFVDAAALPPDFADRHEAAVLAERSNVSTLAAAEIHHSDVASRREALVIKQAWLHLEADVDEVKSRLAVVRDARKSRANRAKELAEAEGQLELLRDRLGLGPEIELAPLMPPGPALDRARGLVGRDGALSTALEARREAAEAAADAVILCEGRLAALAALGRDQPFGTSVASFATLVNLRMGGERKLAEAAREVQVCARRAAAARLPEPTKLRDMPWPPEERLRAELKAKDAAAAQLARQSSIRADAERQRDMASATLTAYRREGPPATIEAVEEARRVRDLAWTVLRESFMAGSADRRRDVVLTDAEAFASAMLAADALSDRRADQADRVAACAEAARRGEEAVAAVAACVEAVRALDETSSRRHEDLRRAFPEAHELRRDLDALAEATTARNEILAKLLAAETTRGEGEALLHDLEPALAQLVSAERKLGIAGGGDLADRIQVVSAGLASHDAGYADYRRGERELAELSVKVAAAERDRSRALEDRETWRRDWAVAIADLGLSGEKTLAEVDAVITSWIGARGELRSLSQTQRRLKRMDDDEADLKRRVVALAVAMGIDVVEDAVASGAELISAWTKNDAIRLRRETLEPEVAKALDALEAQRSAGKKALAALTALQLEAGAADGAAAESAAARCREVGTLRGELASADAAARLAGDELPIEILRRQAQDRDLDQVRAALEDLVDRAGGVDLDLETAIRAEEATAASLQAHEHHPGAANAIARREVAAAGMHDAIERYVELTLARDLVHRAVQTVRLEQQDPLVRRAGTMFAEMTGGEFSGIEADVDGKGLPTVVGVKGDGTGRQSVPTMSDGTRDQLYLAFRLASLANYSAAVEPIPLIADDALVHFDDPRSGRTMELLADFSATTQVVLFTHHESVRRVGQRLAERGCAAVLELT